jgi:hypothetical protein
MATALGNCDCVNGVTPQGAPCPTLVFLPKEPIECIGVASVLSVPTLIYDCQPIGIPKIKHSICANCSCKFVGIKIKTLPQHGTLYLNNVPVSANQVIEEQENGLLVFVKTALYVGADTLVVNAITTCGVSNDYTINITCTNVDCTVTPCTTC